MEKIIISIVTPCYNEQENVLALYDKVKSVITNKLQDYDYDKIGRLQAHNFQKDEPWNHKIKPMMKTHIVGTFNPRLDSLACQHSESYSDPTMREEC